MNETVGQTCHVRLSEIIVPPKRLRVLRRGVVAQLADASSADAERIGRRSREEREIPGC